MARTAARREPRRRTPHGAALTIAFEPELSSATREQIELGLAFHNIATTRLSEYHAIALVLRDASGEVRGGLLGELWGGWLHVSYLWVDAPLRRAGWGRSCCAPPSAMPSRAAPTTRTWRRLGFQARPLYEALGYEVFATLDDCPPGHQFFLRKALSPRPARAAARLTRRGLP
ncbi:MAG: hypothetical protein U0802_04965 [Candidatus Binatia bacterium]